MGRTLHFRVTTLNKKPFSNKEIDTMYQVSQYYNSGEFENAWTCENFFIDFYAFYPNWNRVPDRERNTAWDKINQLYDDLERQGKSHKDIVSELVKKRIVCLSNDDKYKFSGFVKTQGNEYNSMLVYLALITISKKCPNLEIKLSDEGDYLLCPLFIRSGKVLPDFARLEQSIQFWSHSIAMAKLSEGLKDVLQDIPEIVISDYHLKGEYGSNSMEYLINEIQTLKTVFFVLTEQGLSGKDLYTYNLQNRDPKDWFEPFLFSRAVNPEHFKTDKEPDFTHIMSGFYGEYWGRNGNKDSELESYKITAQIQKLLPKDCKLEILPKIKI